jgi:hypothetical protein
MLLISNKCEGAVDVFQVFLTVLNVDLDGLVQSSWENNLI